jgi:hypothetical protein
MTKRLRGWGLGLLLLAGMSGAAGCGDDDCDTPTRTPTAAPSPTATPAECPLPAPFCGGDFPLNTEMTTEYGPAWADVALTPSDFLPCFGPYALCYYANCPVAEDGRVSACECFEWFGPNFVLMTSILNAESYQETIEQCTDDPASCQQTNGAPVCRDVNRGVFYSDASRVSTFGFYRAPIEPIGSTDCSEEPGPYAGCMTAPCAGPTMSNSDGTISITCECPIYDGPYQIGQSGETCDTSPTVWSAAYNPNLPLPSPCDMVGEGCIPDAPEDQCGCPLYSSTTELPPGSGVDCNLVCEQYNQCFKSGTDIQLGYTCDATLCTSDEHGLVFDACLGLQNCDLSEVFKAESAAECSCCATQLCGCEADQATEEKIFALNQAQRQQGETPQCDINGTLCGTAP